MNTATVSINSTQQLRSILKYMYALVPIVAGADKFFNLLTNWKTYLQPVENMIPIPPGTFMMIVGVIEIIAGLLVLWITRIGALIVMAWLLAIVIILLSGHFYDIAVRDAVMAIG